MPDIFITLENFMLCLELADLVDIIVAEFNNQKPKAIPAVKLNILTFLEKAILITNIDMIEDIKD